MADGDLYRWQWREGCPEPPGGELVYSNTRYHCLSCICIEDAKGILQDIYWMHEGILYNPERRRSGGSRQLDRAQIILMPLGNLYDYKRSIWNDPQRYYEHHDLLDIRHPNGGAVLVRKGAKESLRVQMADAEKTLQKAKDRVASIEEHIDRLRERMETAE